MSRTLKNIIHKIQSFVYNLRFGFPSRGMTFIGVTGTDGKTTTVSMIYQVLKHAGLKVAMISTIEVKIGDKSLDSGLHVTTPDPWDVPRYIRMMKNEGVQFVVFEATSNGLDQNRLHMIKFDSAIITNIREDHLDYHLSWENYANAKFKLLKQLKPRGLAVLNSDDVRSFNWLAAKSDQIKQLVYTRAISQNELLSKSISREGLKFVYKGIRFKIPILGEHNFENALQAIALLEKYLPLEKIQSALIEFEPPLGRMQIMRSHPFTIIVDFAHTPNALERALDSVQKIKSNPANRVITVFGCAGKRDKGRRRMGEISAKLSDITVLTAEDPRNEELGLINNEIFKYAEAVGGSLVERFANRKMYSSANMLDIKAKIAFLLEKGSKPFVSFDENSTRSREDAIDFAIKIAEPLDIVFITGKGHEKSLAFSEPEVEYAWSDQEAVTRILAKNISEN